MRWGGRSPGSDCSELRVDFGEEFVDRSGSATPDDFDKLTSPGRPAMSADDCGLVISGGRDELWAALDGGVGNVALATRVPGDGF